MPPTRSAIWSIARANGCRSGFATGRQRTEGGRPSSILGRRAFPSSIRDNGMADDRDTHALGLAVMASIIDTPSLFYALKAVERQLEALRQDAERWQGVTNEALGDLQQAIITLQTTLGVSPQGSAPDVAGRLARLEASLP